jgi:hypothetical protein
MNAQYGVVRGLREAFVHRGALSAVRFEDGEDTRLEARNELSRIVCRAIVQRNHLHGVRLFERTLDRLPDERH